MTAADGGKIVFTGICCLDIVSYLNGFPIEDSDIRDVEQMFTLGGNATNSSKVAAQLNGHSFLYSAIPSGNPLFEKTFEQFGINTSHCLVRDPLLGEEDAIKREEGGGEGMPITIVLVNLVNGSRTMFSSLGGKQWPSVDHFKREFPSLEGFGWFHFEVVATIGFEQIFGMIRHIHEMRANSLAIRPVISIELEQMVEPNWLGQILPLADLVFLAKDFAKQMGWQSMGECARQFHAKFNVQNVTVVCPWGEKGVSAKSGTSTRIPQMEGILEVAAHLPSNGRVVDTLAAGDCFIAGTVHFLNEGHRLKEALEKATFLAGESVGQRGLAGLRLPPK